MVARIPDKILDTQAAIIARDVDRNKKFDAMDIMFFNRYKKPAELEDEKWFRLVPTTQPSDAVWGAMRTLSSIEPDLTYAPISGMPEDKDHADKIEKVLTTHYRKAGRRSKSKHTRQIVWNSLLYDMVAVQIEFIPFMLRNTKLNSKLRTRLERSARFGPFIINVRNAKNVHAVHSELGVETVVYEQLMPAREAVNYYANRRLESLVEEKGAEWVYIVDMMDEEKRYVSAHVGEKGVVENSDVLSLINQKHDLPFVNWIIKGGGSTTESDAEKHFRPLLDSIYHSDQATTVTILRSLLVSDVIYNYFNPTSATTTITGEAPDLETTKGPRKNVDLKVGESIISLPPNPLDVGMLNLLQMVSDDMQRSTAPRILFGEVPSDISFATYNAGVQAASRTIIPHKEVSEDALVELFTQMLMWSQHAEKDLVAFISTKNEDDDEVREKYTLDHREFDINTIDMEVELKADIPIDRQTRVNTAAQLYTALPVSARYALEQTGITDAKQQMEEREQEDINSIAIQNTASSLSTEFMDELEKTVEQRVLARIQQEMKNEQSQQNGAQGAPQSQ
jgi:hypothetical protein